MDTLQLGTATHSIPVKPVRERMCFYIPGETTLVDLAYLGGVSGVYLSAIGNETLEQVAMRYSGVQLMTLDAAMVQLQDAQAKAYKTVPHEITEQAYWDALEVLPPEDWRGTGTRTPEGMESFKMCEYTCGTLTGIYVRTGSRYFSMCDDAGLSHYAVIGKVCDAFPDLREG